MAYVEFLRARRALTWHLGILAVILLFVLYFGHSTTVTIDGSPKFLAGMGVPLSALTPIAMFFAAIYSSSAGTSLNRENLTRDISWTKPVPRTLMALQFIAIDIVAIAIVFSLTMAAVLVELYRMHFVPVFDAGFGVQLVLGLGVGVMWYALLQLMTCYFGPGARAAVGILWPVALLALGLTKVGGAIGAIAWALDIINPLAYMSGVTFDGHGPHQNSIWNLPAEQSALVVWLFSVFFLAIALAIWPRKEA
jgi:hypothetical protein